MNLKMFPSKSHETIYTAEGETAFFTIAIHNTALGNPLGGTRMMDYANEQEAIDDAMRLSEGMTYKFGVTNLSFGGGKATILPYELDKERILEEYAKVLEIVNGDLRKRKGRYFITGEDIGVGISEVDFLRKRTRDEYVIGSSSGSGDPSPYTADGVYRALKVCALEVFQSPSLKNRRVAIQGLGKVGRPLLEKIVAEGAVVLGEDINGGRVMELNGKYSGNPHVEIRDACGKSVFEEDVDILVPCAIGGTITEDVLKKSRPLIVCGSANNQLDKRETAQFMHDSKILYAVDFVANSAGAIRVGVETLSGKGKFNDELFRVEVSQIPHRIYDLIESSKKEGKNPLEICEEKVRRRIELVRELGM